MVWRFPTFHQPQTPSQHPSVNCCYITHLVVCETNGIIAVPYIEVEGNAPHDDEPHVDLHQLPADGAAASHQRVRVLHHHHLQQHKLEMSGRVEGAGPRGTRLSVAGEDVTRGEAPTGGPAGGVGLHVQQGEHRPGAQVSAVRQGAVFTSLPG